MNEYKRFRELVDSIDYKDGYELLLERDQKDENGRFYIQVQCHRVDCIDGRLGLGRGGKAYLSEHMSDGEIVRKAFGLFVAYEEHECREFFQYRGRSIFGPHIDPDALWEAADQMDYRS